LQRLAEHISGRQLEIQVYPHIAFFVLFLLRAELKVTLSHNRSFCMAKKATKRRAWTPEQVRTLKTLARRKARAAQIAKTLKRTVGATRQKAFSMGLSLDSRV
jgi:hypothetical protein